MEAFTVNLRFIKRPKFWITEEKRKKGCRRKGRIGLKLGGLATLIVGKDGPEWYWPITGLPI